MKKLIFIFLLLSMIANAQYKIDRVNAPLNPIIDNYTLDHFNIKGKVISRNNGMTTHFFNEKGLLTEVKSFVNVKYDYNAKGHLKTITSAQSKSEFVCDDQGRILTHIIEDGEGYKYTYNEKGLWTQLQDLKTGNIEMKFTYDSAGRIIKDEFSDEGKLFRTSTYTYNNTENDLEVKVAQVQNGKTTTFMNKYNKRGDCTYTDSKARVLTYDKDNNIQSISGGSVPIQFVYDYKRSLIDWDAIAKNGCITGDCENGYGSKIIGDQHYIGFFSNGKQDGPGILSKGTYSLVSIWKNGINKSYGLLVDTNYLAQGYFENTLMNGKALHKVNGKFVYGNFKAGTLMTPAFEVKQNNLKTGCATGDCIDKYGKYLFENGNVYVGFFNNGKVQAGIFNDAIKNVYNGEYNKEGQQEGFGKQGYANGDIYYGLFRNGMRNGKGNYIVKGPLSQEFMGIWENDQLVKNLSPNQIKPKIFQPSPAGPGLIPNATTISNIAKTNNAGPKQPSFNSTPTPAKTPISDYKIIDLGFGNAAPDLSKTTFKKTLENMYPGYPNKDKKFLAKRIEELAAVKTTDAEKVKFIAEKVEDIIPINKYEAFQVIMNIQQKFQLPVLKYLTPEFRQYVKAEAQKFVDAYYKEHPMR